MKTEKEIDIIKVLKNDYEDKGGVPAYFREAQRIAQNPEEQETYRRAWLDSIPKMPVMLDWSMFVKYLSFGEKAKLFTGEFYTALASFIKEKWLESFFPNQVELRGCIIRDFAEHLKESISYQEFKISSPQLYEQYPFIAFDVEMVLNKERALDFLERTLAKMKESEEKKNILGHLILRSTHLRLEYPPDIINPYIDKWCDMLGDSDGEKLRMHFLPTPFVEENKRW